MIIRAFAVFATLGLLVEPAAAQAPAPALPSKVHATYTCHNLKVPVTYDNVKKLATIKYGSRHYKLPQVESADGGRYMDTKLEWWSKGRTATLSSVENGKAETVLANCEQIVAK